MEYLPSMVVHVKAPFTVEESPCRGSGKMTVDTGDHTALLTVELLR